MVTCIAGAGTGKGQAPMLVDGGMTRPAVEPGIHRMRAMGKSPALPRHFSTSVHTKMAGGTTPCDEGTSEVDRSKARIRPARLGGGPGHVYRGPEELVGVGNVVRPPSDLDKTEVLLGRPDQRVGDRLRRTGAQLPTNCGNGTGHRIQSCLELLLPTWKNAGELDPVA